MDSGSYCNCCSILLVEKLDVQVIPHLKPYKLHWLNEDMDLVVDKQVKVSLSLGNYKDNVLCDVVPMEACHILLGRLWKFDEKTTHNGLNNEITFTHKDKVCTLSFNTFTSGRGPSTNENKNLKNQRIVLRDNVEVWKKSVPSNKVIQIEQNLRKKEVNKILLFEQPSGLLLCKLKCNATL